MNDQLMKHIFFFSKERKYIPFYILILFRKDSKLIMSSCKLKILIGKVIFYLKYQYLIQHLKTHLGIPWKSSV